MLEEDDLTLDKAMIICRTIEATEAQMQIMSTDAKKSSEEVMVNQINRNSEAAAYSSHRYSSSCQYCELVHKPRDCPAYGKSCRKCGKRNHFATVCRSTQPSRPSTSRNIHEIAVGADIYASALPSPQKPKKI